MRDVVGKVHVEVIDERRPEMAGRRQRRAQLGSARPEMREKRVQVRVFINVQPPGPEYPDIIPECPGRSGLFGHISGLSGPNQFQGDKI